MENQPLIRVSCMNKGEKIGLVCYADLVVLGKDQTIAALRIGGYPEAVQGMSDLIVTGCDLELQGIHGIIRATTKGQHQYERKLSHDGLYAEGMHRLKDDVPNTLLIGEESGGGKVALKKNLYFYCKNTEELFGELDRKLSVPLIPAFREYFLAELQARKILCPLKVYSSGTQFEVWQMTVSEDEGEVAAILEDGLKSGKIAIPGRKEADASVWKSIGTFTQYLHTFGAAVAEKIKECFPPRFHPAEEPVSPEITEGNAFVKAHTGYSLYDAQLCAAEALKRQLEKDKMALLIAECGSGKTKIGATALYAFQRSKQKRRSFNVILCPSHITGKWVREIRETVPNSTACHVSTMSDVDRLYEYYLKHEKTVFCILSKETARNGTMRRPSVLWNPIKKGFVCPRCGTVQEMEVLEDGDRYTVKADAGFYLNENGKNHKCQNKACREPLWSAVNPKDLRPEHNPWVRIGSYGFVHRKFASDAFNVCKSKSAAEKIAQVIENPNGVFPPPGAYERFPLSTYIKKRIRRIDALIVDELHQYSGESAQGQAMAELAGIAHKVLGLTATLVNGYAKGIFYLLFRLKSHLMLLDGQSFDASRDFCRQYGVVEDVFSVDASKSYNAASKAVKRKVREKFLPGISPIVYSRFLLENAVFLSLSDMGKELPDYEEIPVFCQMEEAVKQEYERLENEFKKILRENRRIGNKILSSYMNLLTAYPDQPYGHEPVYNPFCEEETLIVPADTGEEGALQPKDEKVLELVERKIKAGENVLIFTAWTRLDSQDKLCGALNERGIPTVILKPSVPTVKREKWVDDQLKKGVRVLIANPALVETGLDLNAFTTLIFYNIAFNLYIFRQASRRSWRINQTAPKVEVYLFCYKDTMQQRALRLMASKLSAATVIEGNVSEEGLAAMSDCEDLTTQLAKELMDGIKENTETLSDAFKQMAIRHERKEEEQQIINMKTEEKPKLQIVKPIDEYGQLSIFDLLAS